jgi:1-phosphofructokinase
VLVGLGDVVRTLRPPPLSVVETRGTGDSMTGALGAALSAGSDDLAAARLAVAAGALNVTPHGLGTGGRQAVEALAQRVEVA